jgi:hypothetical protein
MFLLKFPESIMQFLRMLSEEENELSSCDQTEVASTEDVDAVSTSYGTSTNGHLSSTVIFFGRVRGWRGATLRAVHQMMEKTADWLK